VYDQQKLCTFQPTFCRLEWSFVFSLFSLLYTSFIYLHLLLLALHLSLSSISPHFHFLSNSLSIGRGYFSPTSMVDAYGRGLPSRGRDLSPTVKFTILLGDYLRKQYQGRFYSKATNLRATLTAAYDRHLNPSPPSEGSLRSVGPFVDALVMPTTPFPAPKLPKELLNSSSSSSSESKGALSIPLLEYHVSALNMITNTAPFDVTGHPAITVDCRPTEKKVQDWCTTLLLRCFRFLLLSLLSLLYLSPSSCSLLLLPKALTLFLYLSKLPVGLMIVGRHWEDETVLRIAYAHEKLRKAR
jgi:Asp-tRNA(Asn)/Glu-tRNA(Gln) amidotransferase A subunit family amidase